MLQSIFLEFGQYIVVPLEGFSDNLILQETKLGSNGLAGCILFCLKLLTAFTFSS